MRYRLSRGPALAFAMFAGIALCSGAASAASLGLVEYGRFSSNVSMMIDLGGVNAAADAPVTYNDYNGAATLPGGIPVGYTIGIDRTFRGDRNDATADAIHDIYLFTLNGGTLAAGQSALADASLTIVKGFDTGMTGVTFSLYESTDAGVYTGGTQATATGVAGSSALLLSGFTAGQTYALVVSGNLHSGAAATNVGRYDLVLGLTAAMQSLPPIPVPASAVLLITGLATLLGIGRRRRS
jgi:hypothetical protein